MAASELCRAPASAGALSCDPSAEFGPRATGSQPRPGGRSGTPRRISLSASFGSLHQMHQKTTDYVVVRSNNAVFLLDCEVTSRKLLDF